MATNASTMPLSPTTEIPMLPRLANGLANWGHAIVSLRHRLHPRTREIGPGVVAQPRLVRATKRVDEQPFPRNGKHEGPNDREFIQTQSQLMQTMLKAMILASGWSVEGPVKPNGLKSER